MVLPERHPHCGFAYTAGRRRLVTLWQVAVLTIIHIREFIGFPSRFIVIYLPPISSILFAACTHQYSAPRRLCGRSAPRHAPQLHPSRCGAIVRDSSNASRCCLIYSVPLSADSRPRSTKGSDRGCRTPARAVMIIHLPKCVLFAYKCEKLAFSNIIIAV